MAVLYVLSWGFVAASILSFLPDFRGLLLLIPSTRVEWERSIGVLRDLRERLESGWVPDSGHWTALGRLEAPWAELAQGSVQELRDAGVPVVPTLRRLERILSAQKQADQQARARGAQAYGQAMVCGMIVPAVAVALYLLLPGLSAHGWSWLLCTAGALALDLAAMAWMLALSQSARWAGLASSRRAWWGAVLCFGERLLGAIRSGLPADLAWSRAVPQLGRHAPDLLSLWNADLWTESKLRSDLSLEPAAQLILTQGGRLRQAIQASIYEGKGCAERIEASLEALRAEWDCEIERQLQLLATRALKPLFLLVAPSVLALVFLAFALSWESWGIA